MYKTDNFNSVLRLFYDIILIVFVCVNNVDDILDTGTISFNLPTHRQLHYCNHNQPNGS